MKITLIHGKNTDPTKKWYPWFAQEIKKLDHDFHAPFLPKSNEPIMDEWLHEIDTCKPDKSTILIGHSRGGVAIMRWLEKQPATLQVKKVILIAANSGRSKDRSSFIESNHGFYTEDGYDFKKIKTHCNNFVVMHSTDDKWVPYINGKINAEGLNAKFLSFDTYGHFGKDAPAIPELLKEIE